MISREGRVSQKTFCGQATDILQKHSKYNNCFSVMLGKVLWLIATAFVGGCVEFAISSSVGYILSSTS